MTRPGKEPRLAGTIGFAAGPLLAALLWSGRWWGLALDPDRPGLNAAAAIAVWMAVWWITEALPLAVTALLPVVLFPLAGIMDGDKVAREYFNHVIFLFIGGFIVALAMERWNLHKRIALKTLLLFGVRPRRILLGFMAATAFLSMWISNTATTMMMVTIVLALLMELEESLGREKTRRYSIGLLLGVAYSASIGGMATLVGTPPNMALAAIFKDTFPEGPVISFIGWLAFALPIAVVFLAAAWGYLAWCYVPRKNELTIRKSVLRRQYEALGPLSFAEWIVLADFGLLVLLWLSRADITIGRFTIYGWSGLCANPQYVNDGTVAVAMAAILFLVPSKPGSPGKIMDWAATAKLPWDIVLLFGGGFALAAGFRESGLSLWIGRELAAAGALHPYVLVALLCLTMTFVTELTSNTATTQMILPILAGVAAASHRNPLLLMIPVTLSCSCAFMMPVATPPNAIIFGTGRLHVSDMAKTGLMLNLIGVVLVVLGTWLLGGAIWGIDIYRIPDWATPH